MVPQVPLPPAPVFRRRQRWFRGIALLGSLALGGLLSTLLWPVVQRSEAHRQVVRMAASHGVPLVDLEQIKDRIEPPPGLKTVPWLWLVGQMSPQSGPSRDLYGRGAWVRNCYRDNPHGYLPRMAPGEMAQSLWRLDFHPHNQVRRRFVHLDGEMLTQIDIDHLDDDQANSVRFMSQSIRLEPGAELTLRLRARADHPRSITAVIGSSNKANVATNRQQEVALTDKWQEVTLNLGADSAAAGEAHWDLWLGRETGQVQFAELTLRGPGGEPLALPELPYYIDIHFNDAGNRDLPRTKRRTPGTIRIGCVGDSYTWGAGVLFEDLFTRQLERLLNDNQALPGQRYEVLNFGVGGSAPGEELQKFMEYDSEFELDLLLVTLCYNDSLERGQIAQLLKKYDGSPEGAWASAMREGSRQGFRDCLGYLAQFQEVCRQKKIRFAIAAFQNFDSPEWERMDVQVAPALAERGVPYWNSRSALIAAGVWGDAALAMKGFDLHPSAAAHRAFARGLRDFFLAQGLLASESDVEP